MKRYPNHGTASIFLLLIPCVLGATFPAGDALAQDPSTGLATAAASPQHGLIRQMTGTWDVEARVWFGPNEQPITISAVAERRLIGDALLEEVLTAAPGSDIPPFTRVAFLNYNDVNENYEYISWDTRAPQMMYQTSQNIGVPGERRDDSVLWFYLADKFVVPQWGNAQDIAFKHRLMLEPGQDHQLVRLYWTELSGAPTEEFLAGEYVYTRRR